MMRRSKYAQPSSWRLPLLRQLQPATRTAPVRAILEPAKDQSFQGPFAPAILEIDNGLSTPIRAATLQLVRGGPTVGLDLSAPARSITRHRLRLPAVRAHEEYRLRLFDSSGFGIGPAAKMSTPLAELTVPIDWPAELVTAARTVHPAACSAVAPAPKWPTSALYQGLIALAAVVILAAFALLAPWRAMRIMWVLACAAGGAALLFFLVKSPSAAAIETNGGQIVMSDANGRVLRESILRLASRRSETFAGNIELMAPCIAMRLHSCATAASCAKPRPLSRWQTFAAACRSRGQKR